jgi:hypothetical protein
VEVGTADRRKPVPHLDRFGKIIGWITPLNRNMSRSRRWANERSEGSGNEDKRYEKPGTQMN